MKNSIYISCRTIDHQVFLFQASLYSQLEKKAARSELAIFCHHSYCFALDDEIYAVYLPPGLNTTAIYLGDTNQEFSVAWFDPRNGGSLQKGSLENVKADGSFVLLGLPPSEIDKDWVVQIKKTE